MQHERGPVAAARYSARAWVRDSWAGGNWPA